MKKLLFLFLPTIIFSQTNYFELIIKTNSGDNANYFKLSEAYFDVKYNSAKIDTIIKNIDDFQYKITGQIDHPSAFRLFGKIEGVFFNELIFIDVGSQYIELKKEDNSIKIKERPNTLIDKEYLIFNELNREIDNEIEIIKKNNESENQLNNKIIIKNSLLLEYTRSNPNSYVSLFFLIDNVFNFGENYITKNIADLLSFKIKNSSTFMYFKMNYLEKSIFPNIFLRNILDDEIYFEDIKLSKKYTLIDFWFSGCEGCIKQLPKLKIMHLKYKDFDIIGISIDNKNNIEKWKTKIIQEDIIWDNYLDENGVEAKKLNILKYPSNFLLNEKKEILFRDISLEELEEFLKEN